ncbi:hypothetical protein Vafri_8432 [Volvox africanus]|nr:hypothetical protein Vafri_8432 [Volvox africanus]
MCCTRSDLLDQHGVVPDQELETAAPEDSEVEEEVSEPEDDRAALSQEGNLAHNVRRLPRVLAQAQRAQHAMPINLAAGVAAGGSNGAATNGMAAAQTTTTGAAVAATAAVVPTRLTAGGLLVGQAAGGSNGAATNGMAAAQTTTTANTGAMCSTDATRTEGGSGLADDNDLFNYSDGCPDDDRDDPMRRSSHSKRRRLLPGQGLTLRAWMHNHLDNKQHNAVLLWQAEHGEIEEWSHVDTKHLADAYVAARREARKQQGCGRGTVVGKTGAGRGSGGGERGGVGVAGNGGADRRRKVSRDGGTAPNAADNVNEFVRSSWDLLTALFAQHIITPGVSPESVEDSFNRIAEMAKTDPSKVEKLQGFQIKFKAWLGSNAS